MTDTFLMSNRWLQLRSEAIANGFILQLTLHANSMDLTTRLIIGYSFLRMLAIVATLTFVQGLSFNGFFYFTMSKSCLLTQKVGSPFP